MGIQQDSAEILLYAYQEYTSNESGLLMGEKVLQTTCWERGRLSRAVRYLQDKGFIKSQFFLGGDFMIEKVLPPGVDVVENDKKFQKEFGVELNLGLIKFSWAAKER